MQGPFYGHGIPEDLSGIPAALAGDEYVTKLRELLSSPDLFRRSRTEIRGIQEELLYPYLEFFLRHDHRRYYRRLFHARGLCDGHGTLRSGLVLEDLARLRIHSDDLRGDGQRERLITEMQPAEAGGPAPDGMTFVSSGTTAGTEGPVRVFRSNLTLEMSRAANGGLIDWALNRRLNRGETLMHMAPEMTDFMAFAAIGADFLRHRGLTVRFGAKVNDGPADSTIWRRLGPNAGEMRRFFTSKAHPKYFIASGVGLYKMFIEPEGLRRLGMKLALGAPPVYLGDEGVLMIGGGLKRLPSRYTALSQVVAQVADAIKAGWTKDAAPAPVIDMFGLTESLSVFIGAPMDPRSTEPWVKYPHPLTYIALLDSPTRLEPAASWDEDAERLLLYVNFMNLDYLEAVVPGDFVYPGPDEQTTETALGRLPVANRGFIYSRRAGADEGFQIREGCG